jgi:hypothetical protein
VGRDYRPVTSIQLLDGRLAVVMPAGAAVQPIPPSLMGAPASTEAETRVLFDAGQERLVIMVNELFQYSSADFQAEVEALVARWELPAGSRVRTMRLTPAEPTGIEIVPVARMPLERERQAVPVMDAFVRQADSSVQQLSYYVSPNAADDAEGCGMLAFEILRRLTAGARPLAAHVGVRELAGLAGVPALTVTVPPGWVVTTRRGLSFVVHTLHRMTPLGANAAVITVYLGGRPSPLHRQVPAASVTRRPGTLLGRPAEWYLIGADDDPTLLRREALVDLGKDQLHVSSATRDPALESELDLILAAFEPSPVR